jgi:hypothetical protein
MITESGVDFEKLKALQYVSSAANDEGTVETIAKTTNMSLHIKFLPF